jgi:GTP-binding protein YchF
MEIGILGLAGSGKTTLFQLLTGRAEAASGRRGGVELGIATVPDARLDKLSALYEPKKHTPAVIRYADIPGVPEKHQDGDRLNIPELRTMDALMLVVRAFENPAVPHPLGSVDPPRDLARIEEELLLQDQLVVERRLERLERDMAKRRTPELIAEKALLERCLAALEQERPLRGETWSDADRKAMRGYTFLSLKPCLVAINLDESQVGTDPTAEPAWQEAAASPGTAITSVCATLESELAEMSDEDQLVFMEEMGLKDRALDRIIRDSYRLLGLISFFTVGDDECRAWSIPSGTPAVEAAGQIHSDIQRGFIRAEVVQAEELLDAGSTTVCRQRGTLRLEGKTYSVADGDVICFRFNV